MKLLILLLICSAMNIGHASDETDQPSSHRALLGNTFCKSLGWDLEDAAEKDPRTYYNKMKDLYAKATQDERREWREYVRNMYLWFADEVADRKAKLNHMKENLSPTNQNIFEKFSKAFYYESILFKMDVLYFRTMNPFNLVRPTKEELLRYHEERNIPESHHDKKGG